MSSNKEGIGSNASRLQNWIEHELLHLAMHEGDHDDVANHPNRNLSLRIPVGTHLMLLRLAQKLGRSKTACAEEILTNAVRDAYEQFGLAELSDEDLRQYVADGEKTPEATSGSPLRARHAHH